MSDRSERFFKWVWRLNGLLILGLVLVGSALVLALAFNIGVFASRERPEQKLSEVAGANLSTEDLRLADFRSVTGTNFLYAELASPSEYIGSGSSGGLGRAHNLLFFDITSKKAHWLLANNDQTITSFAFLLDPPEVRYRYLNGDAEKEKQVAVAVLLEIEEKSSEASASGSTRRLALAAPDGRALTPIRPSIQALLGYHHARKDALLVFYVESGAARVLDVDPISRTVRSDEPLATQD